MESTWMITFLHSVDPAKNVRLLLYVTKAKQFLKLKIDKYLHEENARFGVPLTSLIQEKNRLEWAMK